MADTDCYLYDLPDTFKVRSQTISTKWYLVRKFGPNLQVCDCEWAKRGNTCKHVLKILDLLKRTNINQQGQVVGKYHLRDNFNNLFYTIDYYIVNTYLN